MWTLELLSGIMPAFLPDDRLGHPPQAPPAHVDQGTASPFFDCLGADGFSFIWLSAQAREVGGGRDCLEASSGGRGQHGTSLVNLAHGHVMSLVCARNLLMSTHLRVGSRGLAVPTYGNMESSSWEAMWQVDPGTSKCFQLWARGLGLILQIQAQAKNLKLHED